MIEYKPLIFNKEQIESLYNRNKWYAYTKNMPILINGIKNSLYVYCAYEKEHLIGLVRVIGDGHTIIYIQDILIDPLYQRKGIGSKLLQHVLEKYNHVRQVVLMSDNTEKQKRFYKRNNFKDMSEINIVGFVYNK